MKEIEIILEHIAKVDLGILSENEAQIGNNKKAEEKISFAIKEFTEPLKNFSEIINIDNFLTSDEKKPVSSSLDIISQYFNIKMQENVSSTFIGKITNWISEKSKKFTSKGIDEINDIIGSFYSKGTNLCNLILEHYLPYIENDFKIKGNIPEGKQKTTQKIQAINNILKNNENIKADIKNIKNIIINYRQLTFDKELKVTNTKNLINLLNLLKTENYPLVKNNETPLHISSNVKIEQIKNNVDLISLIGKRLNLGADEIAKFKKEKLEELKKANR